MGYRLILFYSVFSLKKKKEKQKEMGLFSIRKMYFFFFSNRLKVGVKMMILVLYTDVILMCV